MPLAKILPRDMDMSYLEIDISSDSMLNNEMKRKLNGMRTVPQIPLIKVHLSDFSDLFAMQQFGKLKELLKD